MTEKEFLFKFAGLAMQALINSSMSRSPGQIAETSFNLAEWMAAEAYNRNLLRVDEFTRASVYKKLKGVMK